MGVGWLKLFIGFDILDRELGEFIISVFWGKRGFRYGFGLGSFNLYFVLDFMFSDVVEVGLGI